MGCAACTGTIIRSIAQPTPARTSPTSSTDCVANWVVERAPCDFPSNIHLDFPIMGRLRKGLTSIEPQPKDAASYAIGRIFIRDQDPRCWSSQCHIASIGSTIDRSTPMDELSFPQIQSLGGPPLPCIFAH